MRPLLSSLMRFAVFGLATLLLFFLLVWQFHTVRGHDQASYLLEAQRLLSGAELYGNRISETNPPVIIWFSAIPVLIARWLHSDPQIVLRGVVVAMMFVSVGWSVAVLKRSRSPVAKYPFALWLLGAAILLSEILIGTYDEGQREHLLIILLLPYVLAVATGAIGWLRVPERCLLGIAAGLAIWFKPHDVLVVVALELFCAIRLRSLRRFVAPEFLALVATCVSVLLLVIFAAPLYGKVTLPLLFDTYWALGTDSAGRLALTHKVFMPVVFLAAIILVLFRRSLRDSATPGALLACAFAASVAYDLQHVTWPYHSYPQRALLLVAIAYLLIDLGAPVLQKLASAPMLLQGLESLLALSLAAVLCVIAAHPQILTPPKHSNELDRYLSQYTPPSVVYIFSTSVPPMGAAYTHHLEWGSRFMHLWMMPAIVQNELGPTSPSTPFKRLSPERVAQLAALQRAQSADDLAYWRPAVVLVQRCTVQSPCQGIEGKNFDMMAWFRQSSDFAVAWSHYVQQPGLREYDVYKYAPQ